MSSSEHLYLALIVLLNCLPLTLAAPKTQTWSTKFRTQIMEGVCRRRLEASERAPFSNSSHGKATDGMSSDATSVPGGKKDLLHVIGLFAMTGEYPAGMSYLPAALLAVKQVNSNPNLLPGYYLQINAYDTQGREPWALDAFYTEVYSRSPPPIMVLGSTCSHVTEATAPVSYLWGMCQVSYSAVSPHLSNKTDFPSFFRVMTPEQNLTVARIKLLKDMGWSRVYVIYQNYKLFSTMEEMLRLDLNRNNITVVRSVMFTHDPWDAVRCLKDADARIIIGSFYGDKARQVMCAAYHLDSTGEWYKKLVWFLPSFLDRRWMDDKDYPRNCTSADIRKVIGNYFSVGSQAYVHDPNYQPVGDYPYEAGSALYEKVMNTIPRKFHRLYQAAGCHARLDTHNQTEGDSCLLHAQHRAAEAYDAVWAIALALNGTLSHLQDNQSLNDFEFGCRDERFPSLIRRELQAVKFNALSGPFAFNARGERTPGVETHRFINEKGETVRIGKCTYFEDNDKWDCYLDKDSVVWNTVDGKPPLDGIQTRCRTVEIDLKIKMIFCSLAALGVLVSVALLIFNIKQRHHVILKRSSPPFNNLILVASILAFATILIKRDIGEEYDVTFCMVPNVTIVFSFSLGFGALFVKNWRLYQILSAGAKVLNRKVARSNSGTDLATCVTGNKMLRDVSLSVFIVALLLVNTTIVLAWFVISPETTTLVNISRTPPVDGFDIEYVNQIKRCSSKYGLHFTVALMAVQGMVMLFGTFLAIQIRKIPKIQTKLLGSTYSMRFSWCVFNVMLLSPVAVIVVMATGDKPEINYALKSTMIIMIATMTLTLIFAPKITSYCRYKYWYTKTKTFKKQQKIILSSRDVCEAVSHDDRKAQVDNDYKSADQNHFCQCRKKQQTPISESEMDRKDAGQQTEVFHTTVNAQSASCSSLSKDKEMNDPKAPASPSELEKIGFSLCGIGPYKRSNSDTFLRRLSLESYAPPVGKAPGRKGLSLSSSNVMVEVKTDMKVKSRMACQRSRSERKQGKMKMARIRELLTEVRERENDCSNIPG